MNIRLANQQDIHELINMRLLYLNEHFGMLDLEQKSQIEKQLSSYFERCLNNNLLIYIAKEKDYVISTVFLVINEMPANPKFITGKVGTLLNVYTKPEYRKQGIAGQLIQLIIDEARQRNLSYIDLKSTEAGYSLYKKLGFIEEKAKEINMKYIL